VTRAEDPVRGKAPAGPAAPAAPAAPSAVPAEESPPPFRLPGEHFAAALSFLGLGAIGLVWIAPALARGAFLAPRVVATAHLFTLGWITTSILGALCQFLPVALGARIRSERLAHAGFVAYVPGVALFAGGLATGHATVMIAGAAPMAAALLLFAANLAATLPKARRRGLTWWALAGAAFFLVATVALGSTLAGNLRWGWLGANRMIALGVHLHVAVAGWVLLVIVGVAHRLLPMFLLSHGATEMFGKLAAGLLAAGAGTLLFAHHVDGGVAAGAGLIALGVAAFLVQAALHFRHKRKPRLDPGLRLATAGLVLLGLALLLSPWVAVRGFAAPRLATAYGAILVPGALSLFVIGFYYKILPFLTWYHRFGPVAAERPVPRVADLFDSRWATAATIALVAGAAGMPGGILAGSEALVRAAAVAFAGGTGIVIAQMIGISRRRPT